MLKNVVLGVVLTSISAGLVYGAVTRTELRETTGTASSPGNYAGENAVNSERGGKNQNLPDSLEKSGSGNGSRDGAGNGQGRNTTSAGEPLELSLADVDETVQFEGIVQDVSADYLMLDTNDGGQILVENRAWWFAADTGFSASAGDEIIVLGFYDDDGTFEAISIENLTEGTAVQIREESGRPLWAGNGSNGNGSGNRQ